MPLEKARLDRAVLDVYFALVELQLTDRRDIRRTAGVREESTLDRWDDIDLLEPSLDLFEFEDLHRLALTRDRFPLLLLFFPEYRRQPVQTDVAAT